MSQNNQLDQNRDQNLAVLASLTELGAQVLDRVAGNEISNSIGGELIGGQALREMIAQRLAVGVTQLTGG